MTKARPAGTQNDGFIFDDGVARVSWTRPDGLKGWAIWASREKKSFRVVGTVARAFNYLGGDVAKPWDGDRVNVAPEIHYLIGSENVEAE